MPKVKLDLEYDLGPLYTAFEKGDEIVGKTRDAVVGLGKESKTAFAIGSSGADKFSEDIKSGTKQISTMDAAAKGLNKVFAETAEPKSLEARKMALAEVKKQIDELLVYEKKLLDQQSNAGPSNIKEQFNAPIAAAQLQVEALRKKLLTLNDIKLSPDINIGGQDVGPSKDNAPKQNQSGAIDEQHIKSITDELKKLQDEKNKLSNDNKPLIPTNKSGIEIVKEIRKEIKNLLGQALELRKNGDFLGAQETTKKIGDLRKELKEAELQIKAVSSSAGKNLAEALGKVTELGAQGFEAIVAAESLFGLKNEEVEKQLLKLQAIQSIARLAGEFGELKEKLTEISLGLAPLTNLYTKGNNALKAFFSSGVAGASNLQTTNKGLFASLGSSIKTFVSSGVSGIKSLWAIIRANPLGIILTVFTALITTLVLMRERVKPIAALFEALEGAVKALVSPFIKLAELLHIIADAAERKSKAIIDGTNEEIKAIELYYDRQKAIAEASQYSTIEIEEKKFEEVRDRLIKTLEELNKFEKENGKLNEEQIKQYTETLAKLDEIDQERRIRQIEETKKQLNFLNDQYKKALEIRATLIKDDEKREIAEVKIRTDKEIEDVAKNTIEVFGVDKSESSASVNELVKAIIEKGEKDIAAIRKKYAEQRKEQIKQLYELEKSFRLALIDLENKVAEAQILTEEDKIAHEEKLMEQQLDLLRQNLIKQGQAIEDFEAKTQKRNAKTFELSVSQEIELGTLQQKIFRDTSKKLLQLAIERSNAISEANIDNTKQKVSNVDVEEKNAISAVQLAPLPQGLTDVDIKRQNLKAIEFERAKQEAILDIQREFAEKKLQLQLQALAAERDAAIKSADNQIAVLQDRDDEAAQIQKQAIIDKLEIALAGYSLEQQALKDNLGKILNELKTERDKLKEPTEGINIYKLLGIKENDVNNVVTAIDSIGTAISSFVTLEQQRLDAQIQQNQQRQQDNESEISSLQSKLDAENDLAKDGKANNVAILQAQLAEQKAAQKKEIDEGKKQLEKKKALQKEQLTIDTITQTSSLITASAQILATVAHDPYSLAIALGTIAVMIGGFVAAKVNAYKAVNEGLTLKDGEIDIKGPGTETSDSIPAHLSKGESVMTAKETRKHKNILLGIRNDDPEMVYDGLLKMLKGTGVILPKDLTKTITNKREAIKNSELKIHIDNNNKDLHNEQKITNKKLDALISRQGDGMVTDGENLIIKRGGHTVIKKLKK